MSSVLKKEWFFLVIILILFLGLRLPAIHLPYHQDEYKWVQYSHPEITPPGTVPHPPLTEFIYTKIGPLVGDNNFRSIPLFFGVINLFLLYYCMRFLLNPKTAQIAALIFTLSFHSVLASLMVDVDGAIMPFFFLILLIGYYKWKQTDFSFSKESYKWIALVLVGAIGGFFIKVSSILPICAVFLDFIIEKKAFSDKKKIAKYIGYGLGGLIALFILLILSKFIFPFFHFEYALKYWEHFIALDRGWLQTFIQCIKALLYSSPFLVFIPLLIEKKDLIKTRVLVIFLVLAFIFYIVLFDFSIGALDRYLELLVIPLTIFASIAIVNISDKKESGSKNYFFYGIFVSAIIFLLVFVNHYVPPLYPKTEWISRILSFKWNFLYPFSGGSGPLAFYVSFLFMALLWIVSFIAIIFSIWKPEYRKKVLFFLIPLGLLYNGMFIEEYLFGFVNGSASKLVMETTKYIESNKDIQKVTVYNDNGGWNIQAIGKYRRRLYIDPKFDITEKINTINRYKEHYMVVDIPRIDSNTVYAKFFSTCDVVFEKHSGVISSRVYDCRNAPNIKI
ncbi:glycosyltransferase family 39 protein [Patescibacteria group bacterium]|nr:glycosyltransferase family 39 protein [Patescibacteria group bacterium]